MLASLRTIDETGRWSFLKDFTPICLNVSVEEDSMLIMLAPGGGASWPSIGLTPFETGLEFSASYLTEGLMEAE